MWVYHTKPPNTDEHGGQLAKHFFFPTGFFLGWAGRPQEHLTLGGKQDGEKQERTEIRHDETAATVIVELCFVLRSARMAGITWNYCSLFQKRGVIDGGDDDIGDDDDDYDDDDDDHDDHDDEDDAGAGGGGDGDSDTDGEGGGDSDGDGDGDGADDDQFNDKGPH